MSDDEYGGGGGDDYEYTIPIHPCDTFLCPANHFYHIVSQPTTNPRSPILSSLKNQIRMSAVAQTKRHAMQKIS